MQISTLFVAVLATAAAASPAKRGYPDGSYDACSGLHNSLQCCATDVLGVADLDCHSPGKVPYSAEDFKGICAAAGQRARCCVLPILGQSILCQTPIGI
ncbi:Cerato-ulmin hydrophobin family [Daldinia caldariorum]|uniref:Cerato-ulmin hydrophobin family n=1 Tax=Daldinia caldariorum TaxID=326644 RepID=UPI00200835E2|nr:Cerato-ulmin hydrophobin family [Daldinia caldariorum]KAI1471685.1 Cerato-ulmin hydrophobin family [Daldinia caldariorum]